MTIAPTMASSLSIGTKMRFRTGESGGCTRCRLRRVVGSTNYFSCLEKAVEWSSRRRLERSARLMEFNQSRRRIQHGGVVEQRSVVRIHQAEIGFAYARCIFQDDFEYRLQLAGRR